jgi:hypothetical protein
MTRRYLSKTIECENDNIHDYNLPVVLYGCETWTLTIREKHRLRVPGEYLDQRGMKLHNEELRGLYSSRSVIRMITSRRMKWAGHVARIGEKRNAYGLLVGKPEGKRPLGRPRRRSVDNVMIDLREIVWNLSTYLCSPRNCCFMYRNIEITWVQT